MIARMIGGLSLLLIWAPGSDGQPPKGTPGKVGVITVVKPLEGTMFARMEVPATVSKTIIRLVPVKGGGQQQVKETVYETVMRSFTMTLPIKKIRAFDSSGRRLKEKEIWKTLRVGSRICLLPPKERLTKEHLKRIPKGMIILTSGAPEDKDPTKN